MSMSSLAKGDSNEVVLSNIIECSSASSNDIVLLKIQYYRATLNAGPGIAYLNKESGFNGGWKVKLIPPKTLASGMTELSFKGPNISSALILDPAKLSAWGYASINEKSFLLNCKYQ